jgi:hypothetical protein
MRTLFLVAMLLGAARERTRISLLMARSGTQQVGACIYCGAGADAKEHWIPRGLGTFKGYLPLLDRVCDGCNRRLGRAVDKEFLRTGEIGFQRAVYGVLGRSGRGTISPFHFKGASADPPTTATMPSSSGDHSILAEFATGTHGEPVTRPLRQLVVQTERTVACIPLPRSWTTVQLKLAVKQRRLDAAKPIEVYLDTDEAPLKSEDYLRTKIRPTFGAFEIDVFRPGAVADPQITELPASANISRAYTRGVAKLAFHYVLWVSNIFRGDEECFREIRDFVSADARNADAIVAFGSLRSFRAWVGESARFASLAHVFVSRLARCR